jgi:SAM-dependent methyltransferase
MTPMHQHIEDRSAGADLAFSNDQYEDAYPPGIERYFWNVARNAVIARSLKRSGMDRWPLLEIGCGRGIIVEHLRGRGMDCVGCELAVAPVPDHLRGIVLNRTDFADLPVEQRGRIRGAMLCDVIEHLPEPVAFLRKVRGALPALEGVLVTVPARQELWSEWDRHYGHFRRYDLASLRATLNAAGFKPLFAGYFFHGLYLPAFLLRGRKLRSTSVKVPSLSWFHAIVGMAFQAEEVILPSVLPGTSAIIMASVE